MASPATTEMITSQYEGSESYILPALLDVWPKVGAIAPYITDLLAYCVCSWIGWLRYDVNTANSCRFITTLPLLSDPRPSNLIYSKISLVIVITIPARPSPTPRTVVGYFLLCRWQQDPFIILVCIKFLVEW